MLEVLSLLWGPAKDASVPNVVRTDQLSAANSLGLAATWGTMPLGAVIFAALAGIAKWLGGFSALSRFSVDQESLAIWVDGATYIVSAMFIMRIVLPRHDRSEVEHVPWTQTYKDMFEGLSLIRSQPMVRGVMIGIAGGLLGGGLMVPLGPAGLSVQPGTARRQVGHEHGSAARHRCRRARPATGPEPRRASDP